MKLSYMKINENQGENQQFLQEFRQKIYEGFSCIWSLDKGEEKRVENLQ